MHVAADEHAEPMGRRHAAEGDGKAVGPAWYALRPPGAAQAQAGAEVGGAKADHVVGIAGGDGGGGMAHHRVAGAAAIGNGFPVAEVFDAQRLHQQGLVV